MSAIEAEKILLSVGRKANLSKVGLDKLNIELHRNGVKVDEHLLTSHPRVYACGDITGYSLLAHTAIREAEVAINHILGVEDRMNYDCVPGVVYTNPDYRLSHVGKSCIRTYCDSRYCYSERVHGGGIPEDCVSTSYGWRDLSRNYVLTLIPLDL